MLFQPGLVPQLEVTSKDKDSHPTKTFDLSPCAVCCTCQGWGGGRVLPGTAEYLLGEPSSLLSQPLPRVFPRVLGDLQEPISLKDRLLQYPVPAWLFKAVEHPEPPSR